MSFSCGRWERTLLSQRPHDKDIRRGGEYHRLHVQFRPPDDGPLRPETCRRKRIADNVCRRKRIVYQVGNKDKFSKSRLIEKTLNLSENNILAILLHSHTDISEETLRKSCTLNTETSLPKRSTSLPKNTAFNSKRTWCWNKYYFLTGAVYQSLSYTARSKRSVWKSS